MSLSLVTKKIAVSPVTSEKYSCRMSLKIVSPMSPVKFKGALDKGGVCMSRVEFKKNWPCRVSLSLGIYGSVPCRL